MIMKKAFTLAEVLITLTIIGVIAALTIPTLMQKHQEQELITRLKKVHSVLSNAYAQAIRENGSPDDWDISPVDNAIGAQKLYSYFASFLKIQKNCGANTGCFAKSYKTMTNKTPWVDIDSHNKWHKIMLQDGISILFWSASQGCNEKYGPVQGLENVCGVINIDVNGTKGPNKLGVDTFTFYISKTLIIPRGSANEKSIFNNYCNKNSLDNRNGIACTAWALYKGNMDYLRKDISW